MRPKDWWQESIRDYGMRGLFHSLCDVQGGMPITDRLDYASGQPWVTDVARRFLVLSSSEAAERWEPGNDELLHSLFLLYATARVRDVLLFAHQPLPLDSDAKAAFDQALNRTAPSFAPLPLDQFVAFFSLIGCRTTTEPAFDPILHEIVVCEQDPDPDAPIQIVEQLWPSLLIGELVFTRAGVKVRAGAHHALAGVADRSCLHWEYWRRHRDTTDGSFWWGHNSQWKTQFRRDYATSRGNLFNFDDGSAWADKQRMTIERALAAPDRPTLSEDEAIEFVKNRCLLRNPAASEFSPPHRQVDDRRRG